MGRMKGTGWRGNIDYILEVAGEEGLDKVKEALSEEDRRLIFSQPILPYSWLDYNAYMRFMMLADTILGKGDLEFFKAATMYNARKDLTGIYRIFISFASPKMVLRNAAKVWRQYFDEGEMSVLWQGDNKVQLQLVDFPDIPLHHDIAQTDFIKEAIRIAGAKNVVGTHPRCIARGDAHCLYEFSWE
ncbi:hypothetical protein JW933_06975 [candidate division FCPU426 bacterium]|nr:hypothetical protein [candidate division FCPU426 bacterium]